MTEAEIARYAIEWFESDGATIYKEVDTAFGRADFVAVNGSLLSVAECKKSPSWYLMHQARRWQGLAHHIWIVTGAVKCPEYVTYFLEQDGIGWIGIDGKRIEDVKKHKKNDMIGANGYRNGFYIYCWPRINRILKKVRKPLREYLCEEHQTFAEAGTSGRYWTPWKQMKRMISEYVQAHPGSTYADVQIALPEAPYNRSPKQFTRLISTIGFDNVVRKLEGRCYRLYPCTCKFNHGDRVRVIDSVNRPYVNRVTDRELRDDGIFYQIWVGKEKQWVPESVLEACYEDDLEKVEEKNHEPQ